VRSEWGRATSSSSGQERLQSFKRSRSDGGAIPPLAGRDGRVPVQASLRASTCNVSFIASGVLCAVSCLSVVCDLYFGVLCLTVVPLPQGKNRFAVKINNNNNNTFAKLGGSNTGNCGRTSRTLHLIPLSLSP
jgi:hypothetical protein